MINSDWENVHADDLFGNGSNFAGDPVHECFIRPNTMGEAMSTMKYTLTRGDDDHEVPVTVHYVFHQGREGSRDGRRGLKLEPDEPAHCEIESVTRDDSANEDIDITKRERELIEREVGEIEYEKSFPPED